MDLHFISPVISLAQPLSVSFSCSLSFSVRFLDGTPGACVASNNQERKGELERANERQRGHREATVTLCWSRCVGVSRKEPERKRDIDRQGGRDIEKERETERYRYRERGVQRHTHIERQEADGDTDRESERERIIGQTDDGNETKNEEDSETQRERYTDTKREEEQRRSICGAYQSHTHNHRHRHIYTHSQICVIYSHHHGGGQGIAEPAGAARGVGCLCPQRGSAADPGLCLCGLAACF